MSVKLYSFILQHIQHMLSETHRAITHKARCSVSVACLMLFILDKEQQRAQVRAVLLLVLPHGKLDIEGTLNGAKEEMMLT